MHHPRLALAQANQLIEKTRFQHTEHGSFVLKTSCPVHALQTQGELDFPADTAATENQPPLPFVREVNLVLNQSLQTLVDAIESDRITQLLDQIKQETTPLISSNLCAALVQMQDEKLENDVSIGFGWAASLPAPASRQGDPLRPSLPRRRMPEMIQRFMPEAMNGSEAKCSPVNGRKGLRRSEP